MGKLNCRVLLVVCALLSGCATNSSPPPAAGICPQLPAPPADVMVKQKPNFLERSEQNLSRLLSDLGLLSTPLTAMPTTRPSGSVPASP
ncbi:Uncharacterized protein ChrSV_2406 [Chromobacterium vaccinii]|nr:Uncharacterized protein ChrSW_2406 [Chromobacterium vaccinii]QND89863.1 Uncharacterized protein ChrSV_2406 [Chromobacterium vaccinii]